MIKNYSYVGADGLHFPDALVGDELYYSLDLSDWITAENDTITGIDWVVPLHVDLMDSFLETNNIANVKLGTRKRGTYKIICKVHTVENSKTQTKVINIFIRVF